MPIEVELPDGNIVEFPDGTDNATMERALSQYSASPSIPEPRSDPTEGMGGVDRFLAGMGKSAVDTFRGARQMGTENLAIGTGLASKAAGALGLEGVQGAIDRNVGVPVTESLRSQQTAIDESRRLDAPLMDTGAGLAGNITGYGLQVVAPGAALRGTALAQAALPTTVRGNALQGAVLGAIQPTVSGEGRAGNIALGGAGGAAGAVVGNALSGAIGAGKRGLNVLRGTAVPAADSRAVNSLLAEAGDDLPNIMTPQPSAVPGVIRTLGEETQNPGIMGAERAMRAQDIGGNFRARDISNNAARVEALERIAGTDAEMAAAEAARATQSQIARKKAMDEGLSSVPRTINTLDVLINEQEGRPAVQAGLQQIRDLFDRQVVTDGKAAIVPEDRIDVLDNVRQTIGDMLSGKYGGENAAALRGSRELLRVRDSLNEEIGAQVPSFADYLNAYRSASKPINRMEVGRQILESGSGGVRSVEGLPQLTPGRFSRMESLDNIAAKATGFKKAKADDILSSDDVASIRAIQDDLRRQFSRDKTAQVGSPTMGLQETGKRIAGRAARAATAAMPYGARLTEVADILDTRMANQVKERMAYLLANPSEARRVIAQLSEQDKKTVRNALMALSSRYGVAQSASSAADQPVELNISGGTPGAPVSEAELNALRGY